VRLILLLAGGWPYIVGAALVGLAAALPAGQRPVVRMAQRVLMLIALASLVASATPAPIPLLVAGAAAALAWLCTLGSDRPSARRRIFVAARVALPLCALLAIGLELPHQRLRHLPPAQHATLFVIGDSLSADTGGDIVPWPARLAREHGLRVVNLAVPGATAGTAKRQVDRLPDEAGVVVVLLGGNDLIAGRGAASFAQDMEHVLARATASGRAVVMQELPLPPLSNAYGYAQRRLADRHGVTLIPRRYLASLLARRAATTDGLHLSDEGHTALADLIWHYVGEACRPG
jgi:acyl-CoA thioesterase-1